MSIKDAFTEAVREILEENKTLNRMLNDHLEMKESFRGHEDRITELEGNWENSAELMQTDVEQLQELTDTLTQHIMELEDRLNGTFWKRLKRFCKKYCFGLSDTNQRYRKVKGADS